MLTVLRSVHLPESVLDVELKSAVRCGSVDGVLKGAYHLIRHLLLHQLRLTEGDCLVGFVRFSDNSIDDFTKARTFRG
eukprot:gene8461-biopygen7916